MRSSGASLGSLGVRKFGGGLPHAVHGLELVARRIANRVEPLAAADTVVPAFGKETLGVLPIEQVFGPLAVAERVGVFGVRHVRLTPVIELRLVARAAVRAFDEQDDSSFLSQCATAAAPCSPIS